MASIDASTSGAGGVITTADNTGILNLQSSGATIATVSSTGLSLATGKTLSVGGAVGSPFSMKNRIINGDMVIDQRNAGASVTPTNGQYLVDRWNYSATQSSKFTAQQNAGSVTPPAGFTNYLGFTSTSAYSITSTDYFLFSQVIEGLNVADLGWGTADAKTVTFSAWVRSSLTGTFGAAVENSAANRCYPFSYTISSANTWTQISVTIPGDTTGTWLTTNGVGLRFWFGLGVGSTLSGTAGVWGTTRYLSTTGATSVVGTNGATFYITGVQLEQGSAATSFEWLPYGQKLINCQRYYQGNRSFLGLKTPSGYTRIVTSLPVAMRTTPTLAFSDNVGNASRISTYSAADVITNNRTVIAFVGQTTLSIELLPNNTDSDPGYLVFTSMSAEL